MHRTGRSIILRGLRLLGLGAWTVAALLAGPGPASAYVIQDPTWAHMLPNAMGEEFTVCATGMSAGAVLRTKDAAALWNYEHFTFPFAPDSQPAVCPGTDGPRFFGAFDGVNQISFGGGLQRGVLAITFRFFLTGTADTLECDMHFSNVFDWYTGAELPIPTHQVDWLSLAAHEMGHCMGLGHEDDPDIAPAPVMRTVVPDAIRRLPTNNDLAGRNAIYGIPAGAEAEIHVQPPSESYGNVVIGQFLDRAFTVTNVGVSDLSVASATIIGADATEFLIVSGPGGPFALQADQAREIVVAFQPTGVGGSRGATLELVSDDPAAGVTLVALTGTAVDPVRDMAVTKIVAPKRVTSGHTQRVMVEIQNRGVAPVSFSDADLAGGFVTLSVTSVDGGDEHCPASAPVMLDTGKNGGALFKKGPKVLAPKGKATIAFQVTYACASAKKAATGPDYKHVAQVFQSAIVGTDVHAADDVCPHGPVLGGTDPHPDGTIRDKGCGASLGRGVFGGDVTTEVVAR